MPEIKVLPYSTKWKEKSYRKVTGGKQQKIMLVKDRMENYLLSKKGSKPSLDTPIEVNEIGRVWTF